MRVVCTKHKLSTKNKVLTVIGTLDKIVFLTYIPNAKLIRQFYQLVLSYRDVYEILIV